MLVALIVRFLFSLFLLFSDLLSQIIRIREDWLLEEHLTLRAGSSVLSASTMSIIVFFLVRISHLYEFQIKKRVSIETPLAHGNENEENNRFNHPASS